MRIALVNPFFVSPSTAGSARMWEMVTHFSAKHDVVLVTSNIDYRTGRPLPDESTHDYDSVDGVSVIFIPITVSGKHPAKRAIREIAFAYGASRILRAHSTRIDCAIISSPPLFSMYCVAAVKRAGIPTILEIRDPWPDAIAAQGISLPSPAIAVLRRIELLGLSSADYCVALTPGIESMIVDRTSAPVTTITNMAPSIAQKPHLRPDSSNMKVVFAGSIGVGDGFPQYFEPVFRSLRARDEIQVLIYGDGPSLSCLEDQVRDYPNVAYHGSVPRADLQNRLRECDVGVMYTHPGLYSRIGLYNKFIDYLATGLPIVLAGASDGVMPSIIREYDCGAVVSHEDPEEMVRKLEELSLNPSRRALQATNALSTARQLFDRDVVMGKYDSVIDKVIGSGLVDSRSHWNH